MPGALPTGLSAGAVNIMGTVSKSNRDNEVRVSLFGSLAEVFTGSQVDGSAKGAVQISRAGVHRATFCLFAVASAARLPSH
jgi:hypothetical protein